MKKLLILSIIIIGIFLVGCGKKNEIKISIEEAKEIALKDANLDANQVSFTKEKLYSNKYVDKYDIEFNHEGREYEYEIDAVNGQILEFEDGLKDDVQEYNQSAVTLTMEEAEEIALKHAKLTKNEVTFTEEKLDYDDDINKQKYELEFYYNNKEYSYDIDANTGDILSYEQD